MRTLLVASVLYLLACTSLQAQQPTSIIAHDKYAPVCGADGRCYLNEYYARKAGTTVTDTGNCPTASNRQADTLKWPIKHNGLESCNDERVKDLKDGTFIFKKGIPGPVLIAPRPPFVFYRGTIYRGPCPVCLPPTTLISTPKGDVAIKDINEGDTVWTMDAKGRKVAAPVLKKNIVQVGDDHKVLVIKLDDGRILEASPGHPAANYKPLENFNVGDKLDGATITSIELIAYNQKETQDILPAGATGCYRANGVLIGSTLYANYQASK
jgi:hypothetical protein